MHPVQLPTGHPCHLPSLAAPAASAGPPALASRPPLPFKGLATAIAGADRASGTAEEASINRQKVMLQGQKAHAVRVTTVLYVMRVIMVVHLPPFWCSATKTCSLSDTDTANGCCLCLVPAPDYTLGLTGTGAGDSTRHLTCKSR